VDADEHVIVADDQPVDFPELERIHQARPEGFGRAGPTERPLA
jgi:hypothetical protein